MDKLVLGMIATDNQPFTVVSDVAFKHLMAAAEPRYALKSEKYCKAEKLPEVHQKIVDKIKALIQHECWLLSVLYHRLLVWCDRVSHEPDDIS